METKDEYGAISVRLIGVVDLSGSRAVHAVAGLREQYQPVKEVVGLPIQSGDVLTLAKAYIDRLGLTELYTADLDAIRGGRRQEKQITQLAALGAPLWLDTGVSSVEEARSALTLGATHVIVGLETLPSFDVLRGICEAVGGDRVSFSLDLKDGKPVFAPTAAGNMPPDTACAELIAERAANAGVGSIIVIDLARVGTRSGLDLSLIARVRASTAGLTLVAGGGVRGPEDLQRLAAAGCDAALVATSIHDGRLTPADVRAARHLLPTSQ